MKRVRPQPRAIRRLQIARGNDLVGIDVHPRDYDVWRFDLSDRGSLGGAHARSVANVRGSVTTPVTAAAAAVRGLASSVRPPLPWRPSKLRLLVDTASCPGASVSPFI